MKTIKLFYVLACLFSVSLLQPVLILQAQVPGLINFQSVVQIDGCEEQTIIAQLVFSIYGTEEGETDVLWTEPYNDYEIVGCEVAVELGSNTAFEEEVFVTGGDRWLQVRIDNVTLTPRFRLTSVAFALHADVAERSREDFVVQRVLKINGPDIELGIDDDRDRGASEQQRALVHTGDDQLWINFENDFEGGTFIGGNRTVVQGGALEVKGADLQLGTGDGREVGSLTGQRAMVHGTGDQLILNYGGDFEAGTTIQSPTVIFGNVGVRSALDDQGSPVSNNSIVLIGADGNNNTGMELRTEETTAFIDFSNDLTSDFDVRLRLSGDGDLVVDGGALVVSEGNLVTSGNLVSSGQVFTGAGQPFKVRYGTEEVLIPFHSGGQGIPYAEFEFGYEFSAPPSVIITGHSDDSTLEGMIPSAIDIQNGSFRLFLFNSTSGTAAAQTYRFSWMAMGI